MKEVDLRKKILDNLRMPRLRIERALIVTEAYKKSEGEPMILRRAKVLHEIANKLPISIEDWQLIVGNFSSEPFAVSPHPEACWEAILEGLDEFSTREGDKYFVSEEDKQTLREVLPWWKGKSIEDTVLTMIPPEVKDAYEAGLIDTGYFTEGSGNFSADYKKLLSKGLSGIMVEIERKILELDLANPDDYDKLLFYKAALICCDAEIDYAKRYAELARKLAEKETREKRKSELLLIAQNCERVPKYPARNLFEALQAFWFTHILLHHEVAGGAGIVAGRLDELLYPYIKDISRSDIKKWMKNLWLNYNQIMYFLPGRTSAIWSGHPIGEQPTIAGVNENGEDASNILTEVMLDVEKEVNLPQPDIALMYHDKINKHILNKACDTLLVSMKPKFFNYDVAFEQGLRRGMAKKDLIDLVDIGCIATAPQGKIWGNNGMAFLSIIKALELALNDGTDPLTGKKVGLRTGDPAKFETFDQVMDVFKQQLEYAIRLAVIMVNIIQKVHANLNPQPFASILIDDCLEKGLPVWEGGARYDIIGIEAVSLANVADSLAAIKKLVFEDHSVSMVELLEALNNNFEGKWEQLRERLINDVPKFGNDDDYVDEIAVDVVAFYCRELEKYKSNRGSYYCPSLTSVSAHVGLGKLVGASPDGRKAKRPLADGMSPSQGMCFKGPTAVIKSLTKIDHRMASNGTLLNMKFTAGILKNHTTREKFIQLLATYMKLGGYHVQFNIIDTTKLKDAQLHPDKHPYLLVRVAAYVAQFGQLPRELQDDIIARSELDLA